MRREFGIGRILAMAVSLVAAGGPLAQAQQTPRSGGAAAPSPKAVPRQATAAPAAQPDAKEMAAKLEQLLGVWETQSSKLKTLDLSIRRIDRAEAWGNEVFVGRAILKSPDFAWLNFDKVVEDPKTKKQVRQPVEQIRCTGTEVWQYKSDSRQIFIYPLGNDGRQRKLDEGPLPFLFNMRKAEVKARYRMDLLKIEPEYYVISVIPLEEIDKQSFSKAFLQLDRRYLLPTRIYLLSPNGKDSKDYILSDIKPNVAVADDNFKGRPLPKWDIVRDPGSVGGPQRGGRPEAPVQGGRSVSRRAR